MTNFLDIFELELRKQALVNSKAALSARSTTGTDVVSFMVGPIPLMQNSDLLGQLADVVKKVKNEQS